MVSMDANSTKAQDGVKSLRVIQLSDTHWFAHEDDALAGVTTAASAREVLLAALVRTPDPDLVVVTGDLVHDGSEAGYRRLRRWLAGVGVPVLLVPGNHDDPAMMAACFREPPVRWQRTGTLGGWQIESLNSYRPDTPGGALGETQLKDFTDRLTGGAGPVLVLVHHPPVALGSAWLDAIGLADGEALLGRLARSGRAGVVLWGHAHQAWSQRRGRLALFGTPSTCVQFAPAAAEFALDTAPPGWRWLTLYPGGAVDSGIGRLAVGSHAPAQVGKEGE